MNLCREETENVILECAVALHFFHYIFMRIHSTHRITPAMELKVINRIWNWGDLLNYNTSDGCEIMDFMAFF